MEAPCQRWNVRHSPRQEGWPELMHTISEASMVMELNCQLYILVPATLG
jgi:hypothetical protein